VKKYNALEMQNNASAEKTHNSVQRNNRKQLALQYLPSTPTTLTGNELQLAYCTAGWWNL